MSYCVNCGNLLFEDAKFCHNCGKKVITFAWGICWGLFIKTSVRVKNVIPEETRKWRVPEKILLIVYIFLLGGSIWLTRIGAQQVSGVS